MVRPSLEGERDERSRQRGHDTDASSTEIQVLEDRPRFRTDAGQAGYSECALEAATRPDSSRAKVKKWDESWLDDSHRFRFPSAAFDDRRVRVPAA